MADKVKWGILGPGIIAHEFVQDFRHVGNGVVQAVASRSPDRAQAFAMQYQIPTYYDDYEKLYNDPSIDAIYIATPHNFHFEQSKRALECGKAVLCEKPLTEKPDSSKRLVEIAKSERIYLLEGMWTYFLPAIQKAVSWVNEGRIGKLLHLRSSFGYLVPFDENSRYYNPNLAGGSLLDMGVYNVAMAELFIDKEPVKINSIGHRAASGVDDDILSHIDYGETTATLHCAFRCKLDNHLYLIGEDGYIDIHDFWRARDCKLYKGEKVKDSFDDNRKGNGFEFQIAMTNTDILGGKLESDIVSHKKSINMQLRMAQILGSI